MTAPTTTDTTPLPSPPFIPIPGLPNFRDIGGYPISPSHSKTSKKQQITRRGILYRSAEPSQITPEGINLLNSLGITKVYDLRSQREFDHEAATRGPGSSSRKIREWPEAKRIFAPVFRSEDYSPEAIATRFRDYAGGSEGFVRAYGTILSAATADAREGGGEEPYKRILGDLVVGKNEEIKPLLLHCTAGKDRTGVICGLVLSVLGVDDEVVAHEYSLTDLGLRERHEGIIAHLEKEEVFKGDPEGARLMVRARRENMLGFLGDVRERYGSVEGCFLKTGMLDEEGLEGLRRNMVVDVEEGDEGKVVVDWEEHRKLIE